MAVSKLLEIDDLFRGQHYHLRDTDQCFFFGEYTSGKDYSHSPTNQLIHNFKKGMDRREREEFKYKKKAIEKVAGMFKDSIMTPDLLRSCTLVPIPPSKRKDHPLYDDRMLQALSICTGSYQADIRELIRLKSNMDAVHESAVRPSLQELMQNLEIDHNKTVDLKKNIILFDDVLTTGAHFVACKEVILLSFPDVIVQGVFIARRVLSEPDWPEEIDILL